MLPAASIRSETSFGIPFVSKSIRHQAGTPRPIIDIAPRPGNGAGMLVEPVRDRHGNGFGKLRLQCSKSDGLIGTAVSDDPRENACSSSKFAGGHASNHPTFRSVALELAIPVEGNSFRHQGRRVALGNQRDLRDVRLLVAGDMLDSGGLADRRLGVGHVHGRTPACLLADIMPLADENFSISSPNSPSLHASDGRNIGTPQARRPLNDHVIEFIRLSGVLTRESVEAGRQRELARLADRAQQEGLMHAARPVSACPANLAGGVTFRHASSVL